jgi:plasmid stability protein
MATKKATKKKHGRSRPRLTIDLNLRLKRKIKVAAAAHNLTVSAYITRILDQALPGEEAMANLLDGGRYFQHDRTR